MATPKKTTAKAVKATSPKKTAPKKGSKKTTAKAVPETETIETPFGPMPVLPYDESKSIPVGSLLYRENCPRIGGKPKLWCTSISSSISGRPTGTRVVSLGPNPTFPVLIGHPKFRVMAVMESEQEKVAQALRSGR